MAHPDSYIGISGTKLTFGTKVTYAPWVQAGPPHRQFMGLREEKDAVQLENIVKKYYFDALRGGAK